MRKKDHRDFYYKQILFSLFIFLSASVCYADDPNCPPVSSGSDSGSTPADSAVAAAQAGAPGGAVEPWAADAAKPAGGFLFDAPVVTPAPPVLPPGGGKNNDTGMTYTDPKTGKDIPIKDFKDIGDRTWVQKKDGTWVLLPPNATIPKPKPKKDDDGTITMPDGKKLKPGDKGYEDADSEIAKQKAAEEEAARKKAAEDAEAARKKAEKDAADAAAKEKAKKAAALLKKIANRNTSAADAEAAIQEYEALTGEKVRRN